MATRPYWLSFGDTAVTGLAPTFIQFRTTSGGTLPPPGITAPGAFGLYMFNYEALTSIAFVVDGFTTGLAPGTRYINGSLDPFDLFGYTLNTIGGSLATMGNSLSVMGGSLSVMGTTLTAIGTEVTTSYSLTVSGYSAVISSFSLSVQNFSLAIQGASLLGNTSADFGTDSVDPTSVFGFLKRAQETREGDETYTKGTGILDTYSRGSSVLLIEKTISDSVTETTKE